MIKGILFDIDDTLFSHETEEVPKQTLKALDKLKEKGYKLGVCTSRIAAELGKFPKDFLERFDCKIIGTGATTIVEDTYFKSYTIDKEKARAYTKFFEDHGISYHYADINGDVYYWGDLSEVNNGHWLSYAEGNVMFKPYEDEEVTNLFYYHAKEEEVPLIAQIDEGALISTWGNSGNICAPLVDKSFGLLKFCQVFSFTTDEVAAAGDGSNDDVMLQMAGIGIAVSDAKDNTKAAADYVCKKSIEEGGLYDAFVDLGLIEEDRYKMKMFCFDNDSTLLDHGVHRFHESTLSSLKKLKEKGYVLAMNTSRSYEELFNIPQSVLDLMDALILLNGAYIVKKGEVQVSYIEDETVRKLIAFMDAHEIPYRYCTDDGKGYLSVDDKEKAALFDILYGIIPEVKKYEGERVIQILYYAQGDLREEVISLAKGCECDRLAIAGEISPPHKNKGEAMLEVAASFGISPEEICAFGDGGNDIEMLKLAGLGIAMGNGAKECRYAADYVTDKVSEDGVCNALIHFGFIEK